MCRYAEYSYKTHFICIPCRKHWKGGGDGMRMEMHSLHCPHCGANGIDMGKDFKAPRRDDERQWRKLALLVERGLLFRSCGCDGPGPRPGTLSDAKSLFGLRRKRLARRQREVPGNRRNSRYHTRPQYEDV